MRNIKLIIAYDGTAFKGWQVQSKGERTVQGGIKIILKKLFKQDASLIGSGRTDTGVHALGQTAHFKTKSNMPIDQIQSALNAHLPEDIRIMEASEVHSDFHAQYSIKAKTYRYTILNQKISNPLLRKTAWHYPYKLNVTQMKEAAKAFIGKKDFRAFQSNNRVNKNKDSVRTIHELKIKKSGDLITIDITANGFLYKMVRNIVGTLIEVGSGKITPKCVVKILKSKDRKKAGQSAKAHGLCLLTTTY